MRQGQVEVLAPAGSFESMKAAIGAGADGVYIGGSRFGARAYADNLDQERMLEAIDYAHIRGVSLYMTVNTLMKEKEIEELPRFLRPYYEQGLDGVIVQDLGAVRVIKRCFRELPVHASTQMTITGAYGARILADLGIKRVVLARELSLDEIRRIHEEVPIEIECFVHGALCYCYSGQCLLSSFIGGRSGNRGRCAQPCRLPYVVKGKEHRSGNGPKDNYLLSMKDLCALDLIPDLIEAGVNSLKIEGRMKSPRYTAGVVRVYRKYVDQYLEKGREGYHVAQSDRQELLELFNRGGFTDGYYRQHNGPQMIARKEKPSFRPADQKLFDELDRLYVEKEKKELVKGVLTVKEGQEISLDLELKPGQADGKEPTRVSVRGARAESARNQPVSIAQLEKQIKKTGDMPFIWEKLDIRLEGQAFVPVQVLNELRRRGLEQLRQCVVDRYKRTCPLPEDSGREAGGRERQRGERHGIPGLSVLLSSEEGLSQILSIPQVFRVYVEADGLEPGRWRSWVKRCHDCGKSCVLAMPIIFRKQAEHFFEDKLSFLLEAGFDGILVRSLEEIGYLRQRGVKLPVYGDHNLYSFNSETMDMLLELGCQETTFPLELNSREMGQLFGESREMIGYGFLPAMVSAQCVRKTVSGCSRKPGRLIMQDRMGKELPVENHCAYCYNIIYNPLPLSLADQMDRIRELAPKAIRLQFTGESPEEIRQIVAMWAKAVDESQSTGERVVAAGSFTRGHFRRGVE